MNNYFESYLYGRIRYFFKQKAFKDRPVLTLFRLLCLFFLILFKKEIVSKGKFGNKTFLYNLNLKNIRWGGRGYFLYRNKQESILEFGERFLKKGDVVLDCGANQGIFTLSFRCKVGKEGKLFCVEPFSQCVKAIKKNLILNNYKNIKIYPNVISDSARNYKIDYSNGITEASIVKKGGTKQKKVKSITIDSIVKLNNLKKLDFIKLDVEGAEHLALIGGLKSIKKFNPIIYLECSNKSMFNKIKKFSLNINYKMYYINNIGKLIRTKKFSRFKNKDRQLLLSKNK